MKNSITGLVAGLALSLISIPAVAPRANASFRNYQPNTGTPFVSGNSSFDWSNWSYADGRLTNNAGSNRTWTVSMTVDNAVANTSRAVFAEMKVTSPGQGNTTGQAIANDKTGLRTFSGQVLPPLQSNVCGGAGVFCDTHLGFIPQPFEGTIYVNFVIGSSGGQIARVQVDQ